MTAHDDLAQLSDDSWQHVLTTNPSEAHLLGIYPRGAGAGRFESCARRDEDADIAAMERFLERARAIPAADLDDADRLTLEVLVDTLEANIGSLETHLLDIGANPIFGEQTMLPLMFGMLGLPDREVAEAMTGVLDGAAQWFRDLADRHREGLARGWAPAEFAVTGTLEQIEAALAVPLDDDPIVAALHAPEGWADEPAWREQLRAVVGDEVRPAMAAYAEVLRDEVLPRARPDDKVGLSWLPGGDAAYEKLLRHATTTTMTAQEIHDIGLAQIESLAAEYRALGATALGTDDLAEIFRLMREDPALHFETGEQLVEASEAAMAKASAAMGDWFSTLPKAPCGVEATMTGAKAFYFPPATDGSRGGTFFVNVDDPSSWGTFELEAMAFHEGIPGHHLQLSIASELPDTMPEFRKHVHATSYAEGWGLYSERLADEMGLYASEIDRLGMLSADSMRACRLVVDTGIHALGWSRQQAVDYMLDNSPLAEGVVRPEIDRYVVMPGQATSYMVGRLEIQRIRREAEQRQGDRFAIKDFHAAVLDNGSLPLGVLDRVVAERLA